MINLIRQLSIFGKILNVKENEWLKIAFVWFIRLFYRFGFVIGWTLVVTIFVKKFDIVSLPYLFILNALLTFLGAFLFSYLFKFFDKEKLLIFSLFSAITTLILSIIIYDRSTILFFSLLLISESIFLMQFKILSSAFFEKYFSPIESERLFPLIESSDTLGGIFAALFLVLLSVYISTDKLIYLWIFSLFIVVNLVLYLDSYFKKVPSTKIHEHLNEKISFREIKQQFFKSKYFSFFAGISFVIFLQWFLFNIIDFQFTSIVFSGVKHYMSDAGSGFEHAFIHDLGFFFLFFSISSLFVQLLIGGRLIDYLGVVGSMVIHPIVTLLSLVGMLFSMNFYTSFIVKHNFTVTSIIHTNAYHSTYYAIDEKYREYMREFIEGFIRPLGALFGALFLIVLKFLLSTDYINLYLAILLIVFSLLMIFVTLLLNKKYTSLAVNDLLFSKNKEVRINAIEILGQKGHLKTIPILLRILRSQEESTSIRVKILQILPNLEFLQTISEILNCLDDKKSVIRENALNSLIAFKSIKKYSMSNLYLRLNLVNKLKEYYKKDNSDIIHNKIITLLSLVSNVSAIEFLLEILNSKNDFLKAEAIYALGNYKDKELLNFIKPFLNSENLTFQMYTVLAMGRLKRYKVFVQGKIDEYLNSQQNEKIALALFVIGELKLRTFKKLCLSYLYYQDQEVRMQSAVALSKMGYMDAISNILDMLFTFDKDRILRLINLLNFVDPVVLKSIEKLKKQVIENKLNLLFNKDDKQKSDFSRSDLSQMRWLYCLIDEHDEIENIDKLITNNI